MIVELFGPPGSGKTTFAHALAARLREDGYTAELVVSYRPAERPALRQSSIRSLPVHQTAAVVRRVTRPLIEALTLARHPLANYQDLTTALNLVRTIPPRNPIWSIRLSQYLSRLSHSWYQASSAAHIVLFDQAYIQVVCSLVILSGVIDEGLLTTALYAALNAAPKPDLLIRLDVPRDVLKARLRERERQQGVLERLFEFDLKRNLQSIQVLDRLHDILCAHGEPIACASSLDASSLSESVRKIEGLLVGVPSIQRRGAVQ